MRVHHFEATTHRLCCVMRHAFTFTVPIRGLYAAFLFLFLGWFRLGCKPEFRYSVPMCLLCVASG